MNCEGKRLQVVTNVLDVLPDGTITKLILKTKPMNVTIRREEPDHNLMIDKIEVIDQEQMKEALETLSDHLSVYCICSIDVNCVDGTKATLNI